MAEKPRPSPIGIIKTSLVKRKNRSPHVLKKIKLGNWYRSELEDQLNLMEIIFSPKDKVATLIKKLERASFVPASLPSETLPSTSKETESETVTFRGKERKSYRKSKAVFDARGRGTDGDGEDAMMDTPDGDAHCISRETTSRPKAKTKSKRKTKPGREKYISSEAEEASEEDTPDGEARHSKSRARKTASRTKSTRKSKAKPRREESSSSEAEDTLDSDAHGKKAASRPKRKSKGKPVRLPEEEFSSEAEDTDDDINFFEEEVRSDEAERMEETGHETGPPRAREKRHKEKGTFTDNIAEAVRVALPEIMKQVMGSIGTPLQYIGSRCIPSSNTNSTRAISKIKGIAKNFEYLALAESTRKNYNTGAKSYINFCLQMDLTNEKGEIGEVNEDNLRYFAAHCAGCKGLAPKTIHNYLYGVRSWQIKKGLPDPLKTFNGQPLHRLALVLRGIKKCHRLKNTKRLPITIHILKQLMSLFSLGCFGQTEDRMMMAVINLAFFGFMRCGEFTIKNGDAFDPTHHLTVNDINFYPNQQKPTHMTLRLKYSKTDPFGKGHTITLYKTNRYTCAVTTMQHYLYHRRTSPQQPLFLTREAVPLTRKYFIDLLREAINKLGFSPTLYAGHSFRIGAATTAAATGMQDWLIRALGRWSSDCYKIYIRTPLTTLQSAANSLATCPKFDIMA